MNSLPFVSCCLILAHEILLGKLLLTNLAKHWSAKLVPKPFRAQAKKKILVNLHKI